MPLYYFDFRDSTGLLRDEEGFEHPDIDAAEREAMEVAAGIGRDRFPQGDRSIIVEVRDELGQRVTAVAVTLHVDRAILIP